jgi:biopolymer transport protein ExbD
MRVPNHHQDRGAIGVNMTPMIDVVFLLIIFFLVSSHLAKQEIDVELALPRAASGDANETDRPRATINVLADGQILLAGRPVDRRQLGRRIGFEIAKHAEPLEVRIRADRGVPYQMVAPILRTCADAGAWNVEFAVLEKKTP